MDELAVFYGPDMGCMSFEGMAGGFIGSFVIPDHRNFIAASENFGHVNIESIVMNGLLHEHIGDDGVRSGEMTVFFYERHTAAFVPFDGGIKEGQCGRHIT